VSPFFHRRLRIAVERARSGFVPDGGGIRPGWLATLTPFVLPKLPPNLHDANRERDNEAERQGEAFEEREPEIVAMLDAVPDLRPALNGASEEELVEIFRAFDLTITYDKDEQRLHLAATITPELLPVLCPNESDRPEGRSQINDIAGAGFEPATFGL
jgi:hypothetical protein